MVRHRAQGDRLPHHRLPVGAGGGEPAAARGAACRLQGERWRAPEGHGRRARVELVLPDDKRRLVVRVLVGGRWAGDLLFAVPGERDALLGALARGALDVVSRALPPADYAGLEPAQAPC
ncbi:hypothetical protein [Prauserella shujinwangii]|uniref:hypothetical protein n=1 Tax=Prauserella shujinwangii TaxID=1453103 RepID=UPI0011B1DF12|nr:hypothetical protein [Prauserella shujinwangii]